MSTRSAGPQEQVMTRSVRRDLAAAISTGLRALSDTTRPDLSAAAHDVEAALRRALEQYRRAADRAAAGAPMAQAAAAARTACAHLAADDVVDAYLALRAAHDALRQVVD